MPSRKALAAQSKRRPQTRRHNESPMPAPYEGKRTREGFTRGIATAHREVYMGMARPKRGACTRYAGYTRTRCETDTQFGVAQYLDRNK